MEAKIRRFLATFDYILVTFRNQKNWDFDKISLLFDFKKKK